MSASTTTSPDRRDARIASATALRRTAEYAMPPELDRRMLDLGERQDHLGDVERAELVAWVAFAQQRSVDKFAAELALPRLTAVFPEI